MILELPYPPSVNMYWRHTKAGRHYISAEGKAFRETVGWIVKQARASERLTEKLDVTVQIFPPDKRRRDIDNVFKSLLDALQHAGGYEDDFQIDRLAIVRCNVEKPGKCIVTIAPRSKTSEHWALDNCS